MTHLDLLPTSSGLCIVIMSFLLLTDCTDGDIRLIGANSDSMGTVEHCINGEWTTICDNGWTTEDAQVVCAQLGQPSAGEKIKQMNTNTHTCTQQKQLLDLCTKTHTCSPIYSILGYGNVTTGPRVDTDWQ